MQAPLSIAIKLQNDWTIRAVHSGECPWFAMVDLFGMVSGLSAPDQWPRPARPPVPLLSRVCRTPAENIVRKFQDFGFTTYQEIGVTTQFIEGQFVSEFLRLAGFPDEPSVMVAKDLIDTANTAYADRKPDPEMPPLTSEGEVVALKVRLAKVENELAYQAKRTSALERRIDVELRQFQMRLNIIDEHIQQNRAGETSRELKAHANRLYARSKQLENEGL